MKVKILGTEYEIILNAKEVEYPKLKGLNGYTDFSIKTIVLREFEADESSLEDLEYFKNKVLKHEIIHAFFYESGLDNENDFARNEELIDWLSIQFEKMLNVFIEVNAINSIGIDINIYDRTSNDPTNDPVNSPKAKEAKASIKLPELKMPKIEIDNKAIIESINKSMERINSGMRIGGSG